MNFKKLSLFILSGLCLLGAVSCAKVKRGEYAKGSATIFADDGFRNLVQEEISVFEFSYPESSIIPFFVSEREAIDTMMADATQAIIITREFTPDEKKFMKDKYKRIVRSHCIAVDAVALITNKDNPVKDLSMDEISKILNGEITKWTQIAGNDTTSIKLVFDNAGSSTVNYLREKFLKDGKMISDNPNAFAQKNNAQVFDVVKKDKDALGVISVSWLGDDLENAKNVPIDKRVEDYQNETDTIVPSMTTEVNIVKVSNPNEGNDFDPKPYAPYQVYINSGQYPLFRKVYMISTATKSTVLNSFYTFVTGFAGQKIIMKTGLLPYNTTPRVVELK
ncbi:MAG: substrate-binding domain-containing protein [Muribaculaceae bacterium]|nr:substrate-binding domain-containing protein [Muribaculaceae bacterium]MDE6537106.1 substrate-binding domain-containing protein [Muribaculaceae bacterium]